MDMVELFVPNLVLVRYGRILAQQLPEIVSRELAFEGFAAEQRTLGADSVVMKTFYGDLHAICPADILISIQARLFPERALNKDERVRLIRKAALQAFKDLESEPVVIVRLVLVPVCQSGGPGEELVQPPGQTERASEEENA